MYVYMYKYMCIYIYIYTCWNLVERTGVSLRTSRLQSAGGPGGAWPAPVSTATIYTYTPII